MSQKGYDFSGTYQGEMDGISTSLNLTQKGSNLTGDINKGGLLYNVVGIAEDDSIQGRMSDAENIEHYMLQAEINNSFLIIHLITHNLDDSSISKNSFTFKKSNTKSADTIQPPEKVIKESEFNNDKSLLGIWAREEILTSPENAISTQVVIELDSKGNYSLVGAINLKGAKDTGYSGDTTKGKWRTHNGTFHILVSGSKYWKPYARYKIDGPDEMTFTLEDGERLNWVKQHK